MLHDILKQNKTMVFAIIPGSGANRYDRTCNGLRKTKAVLALFFILASLVSAQWIPHGPGPNTKGQVENITDREVIGAINAVATHPADAGIIYAGGVNGGIWKTENATDASPDWENQTPAHPALSIGALEFDPFDGTNQTLVAGIGLFSSNGQLGSERAGLLRTTNGGANWNSMDGGGAIVGLNISGVAPYSDTIVVSANTADVFANRGIWRTIDGGATWTHISGGAGTGLPAGPSYDLVRDPADPSILVTNSGANGIYQSTDMGATWTDISDATVTAALAGGTGNMEFAIGNSNNIYATVVSGGQLSSVLRSGDGGTSWTSLDIPFTTEDGGFVFGIHPGAQGNLHLSIAADPVDANIVYIGGDRQPGHDEGSGIGSRWPNSIGASDYSGRLFRIDASQPAGNQVAHITNGNTASGSSPHADSRDMKFNSNDDLIEVDDGGIYKRTDPELDAGDWFSLNGNIQTTEFHGIAWDSRSKIVIGGTQDTGTPQEIYPGNKKWESVSTGDGGDVEVDDISTPGNSVRYSSFQRFRYFRRRVYTSANEFVSQDYPSLTVAGDPLGAQFFTPIKLNAVDATRLIIGGSNSVYESLDQGDNITEIGHGIVVNANGRSPIAYGAADNADILYVGAGNDVYVRTAADPSPLNASAAYAGGTVSDVTVDPDNSQIAYVIDNDEVFQTTDAGASWNDITGNIQTFDPGMLRTVVYSTSNADGSLIVGSDNGVYIASGPAFNVWAELGPELPNAQVFDMEYDAADEILLVGTLGRGAYTFSLEERDPVDVMLVLDISGSMNSAACPGCDAKLDVLKEAVEIFINLWRTLAIPDDRLGVIYFKTDIYDFEVGGNVLLPVLDHSSSMIEDVKLQTTVGTNLTAMGGGLQFAINNLTDDTRPRNIILFTDGMQNVNPKVNETDLDIEHDLTDPDYSNIDPTDPPTRLDTDLDIKVNTIGVGATDPFVELLDDIAGETNGLTKITTTPDEELRRFYVEELVDALKSFSPQLVDYRYGNIQLAAGPEILTTAMEHVHVTQNYHAENFTLNNGSRKVIFKLSWKRDETMHFFVVKDGINLSSYKEGNYYINGEFYQIFSIDLPAKVGNKIIRSDGDWHLYISGQPGAAFELAAITDDHEFDYHFSVGREDYIAGQPVELTVDLSFMDLPVTDADKVTARIFRPKQSVGTILSVNNTPQEPQDFSYETGATAGQKKLQLMLTDDRYSDIFKPVSEMITLVNNGDGTYTGKITNTNTVGNYKVQFFVEGEHSVFGKYLRTETMSTMVRFGKAVFKKSDVYTTLTGETADSKNMLLHIRPKDQYGNYLGPDYGSQIKVSLSEGIVRSEKTDQVNGGYTIPLTIPLKSDPVITITVMDEQLFKDKISKINPPKFALSLHAGLALPTGALADSFNSGMNVLVDISYSFSPKLSLVGYFGYNDFKSRLSGIDDNYWLNISLNVKYRGLLPPASNSSWYYYLQAGPGYYIPEKGNSGFGANVGAGFDYDFRNFLTFELGTDFHTLFDYNVKFWHAHAGVIFRF